MLVWNFPGCMEFTDWLLANQISSDPVYMIGHIIIPIIHGTSILFLIMPIIHRTSILFFLLHVNEKFLLRAKNPPLVGQPNNKNHGDCRNEYIQDLFHGLK